MAGAAGNRDIQGRFPLKATDIREISVVLICINKFSSSVMQVDNRAILHPILKKMPDGRWAEATGAIGVTYDAPIKYATLHNASNCDLELLCRIV